MVGVAVGDANGVGVAKGVDVLVGETAGVGVSVKIRVAVVTGVLVGVFTNVDVEVGVRVGVGVLRQNFPKHGRGVRRGVCRASDAEAAVNCSGSATTAQTAINAVTSSPMLILRISVIMKFPP